MAFNPVPAYEANHPFVYVYYSSKDEATAVPILTRLYNEGFRLWSSRGSGSSTEFRAAQRIGACTMMMIFLSSNLTDEVNLGDFEARAALSSTRVKCFIRIDRSELPFDWGESEANHILDFQRSDEASFWLGIYNFELLEKCRGPWPEVPLTHPDTPTFDSAQPEEIGEEYSSLKSIIDSAPRVDRSGVPISAGDIPIFAGKGAQELDPSPADHELDRFISHDPDDPQQGEYEEMMSMLDDLVSSTKEKSVSLREQIEQHQLDRRRELENAARLEELERASRLEQQEADRRQQEAALAAERESDRQRESVLSGGSFMMFSEVPETGIQIRHESEEQPETGEVSETQKEPEQKVEVETEPAPEEQPAPETEEKTEEQPGDAAVPEDIAKAPAPLSETEITRLILDGDEGDLLPTEEEQEAERLRNEARAKEKLSAALAQAAPKVADITRTSDGKALVSPAKRSLLRSTPRAKEKKPVQASAKVKPVSAADGAETRTAVQPRRREQKKPLAVPVMKITATEVVQAEQRLKRRQKRKFTGKPEAEAAERIAKARLEADTPAPVPISPEPESKRRTERAAEAPAVPAPEKRRVEPASEPAPPVEQSAAEPSAEGAESTSKRKSRFPHKSENIRSLLRELKKQTPAE